MNTRTENLKRYNFNVGGNQAYRERFDAVSNTTVEEKQKIFVTTFCNRCHIKISTHNAKCPCCGEDVDV